MPAPTPAAPADPTASGPWLPTRVDEPAAHGGVAEDKLR